MSGPRRHPPLSRRSGLLWAGLALLFAVAIGYRFTRALWWRSSVTDARGSATADSGSMRPSTGPAGDAWAPEEPGRARGLAPAPAEAPSFSFIERSGRTLRRSDLDGKVWIADFIFTRCPSICPALTRKMAEVRHRLAESGADDVISVSFSVDPVNDTPQVLSAYAAGFGASPSSWLFLTGDPKEMLRVVNQGFHLIMVDPEKEPPGHSNRFVLVDAKGRVRGMHDGSEPDLVASLVREALALRQEAGR